MFHRNIKTTKPTQFSDTLRIHEKLIIPANTEIILHISVKHYVKTVKYYSISYKMLLKINFLR